MEIEEIKSVANKGPRFGHSHRGKEVQRLTQSLGAEHVARKEAVKVTSNSVSKTTSLKDSVELSDDSQDIASSIVGLGFSGRPSRILSGLTESFQGNTQDQGPEHEKKSPWYSARTA